MNLQPNTNVMSTAPLPQTNQGILHQKGEFMTDQCYPPGNPFDFNLMFTRDCLTDSFTFKTTDMPGDVLFHEQACQCPIQGSGVATVGGTSYGIQTAYPWQFGLSTNKFINTSIKLIFWAMKPPGMSGRILIEYSPPGANFDTSQRAPAKEWDLSASNFCSFTIDAFTTGLFRRTNFSSLDTGNPLLCNVTAPIYDERYGQIRVVVASVLQSGSIYPTTIEIYVFFSFVNPQLRTIVGFPTPASRMITSTPI